MISKNDIRRESRYLFLQMFLLHNVLKPIPSTPSYSIQLYYNNKCPKGYEPPKYFRIANANDKYITHSNIIKKSIGSIHTGHNEFNVALNTPENRLIALNPTQNNTNENINEIEEEFEYETESENNNLLDEETESESELECVNNKRNKNINNISYNLQSESEVEGEKN